MNIKKAIKPSFKHIYIHCKTSGTTKWQSVTVKECKNGKTELDRRMCIQELCTVYFNYKL